MNQEQAQRLLPIVQAIAEGKTVQWREKGANWEDARSIDFADDLIWAQEFRIKPEQQRLYVVSWFSSGCMCYETTLDENHSLQLRAHNLHKPGFQLDVIERELP